jgi:hypothetical protein
MTLRPISKEGVDFEGAGDLDNEKSLEGRKKRAGQMGIGNASGTDFGWARAFLLRM